MAAFTITINGIKFRTQSNCRFVVFAGRASTVEGKRWDSRATTQTTTPDGRVIDVSGAYVPATFDPFQTIVRRSDSEITAIKAASKYSVGTGAFVAVVDTATSRVAYGRGAGF